MHREIYFSQARERFWCQLPKFFTRENALAAMQERKRGKKEGREMIYSPNTWKKEEEEEEEEEEGIVPRKELRTCSFFKNTSSSLKLS